MGFSMIILPLAAAAVPASGATPAAPDPSAEITQRINDPATADHLARVMQSLSKAFLALPVGEIEAAAEGRAPTAAEKRLTVRDVERRADPNFDRNFAARMAQTRPMMEQSLKAIGQALPAITQSLKQAGDAIERAAANMPDPTYPRR